MLPNRYPLAGDVESYIADEQRLSRMLDYAVIVPRLQRLYEWSAEELGEASLLEFIHDGAPIYAWPFGTGAGLNRTQRQPSNGIPRMHAEHIVSGYEQAKAKLRCIESDEVAVAFGPPA